MATSASLTATIGLFVLGCCAAPAARAVTVTDSSVADFSAGSVGACAIAEVADGEVILTPTEGAEFSGGALPPDWLLSDWNPPTGATTTTVSGGVLLANSARINPDPLSGPAPYGPGRSLEFVAAFGAQAFEHVGFGGGDQSGGFQVYNQPPWANISTGNQTANVLARVDNGSGSTQVAIALADGTPHRYRIDWSATQVDFFVDDVLAQSTVANPILVNMRPAISDFDVALPGVSVDWIRMSPYEAPCAYLSAVIDGGNAAADWTTLTENARLPGGTSVAFETRSGNVPVPDGSWSAFAVLGGGGAIASPNARYLQYRATLDTVNPDQTAELEDVSVSYDACTPSGLELCSNAIDEDCDGADSVCTPTETPTFTPVPPTHTETPTFTPVPTLTDTPTQTPVPPTATNTPTATAGLCGNSNVDAGEQCDDGNTADGDCCSATCQFAAFNSPCNDHNTCTNGEKCDTVGRCVGFTSCNTTLTCDICGSKCKVTAGVCKCG
jgi:cysteine-rich repeat protein